MTPRSILFFRPADLAILDAPAYDWTVDNRYELLINNKTIGLGEAVKVGENFGLRINQIGDVREVIRSMGR